MFGMNAVYYIHMTTIHENLKVELKEALKAKDTVRLRTVRSLLTALTNELVANEKTPQDIMPDEAALTVIKRAAKQRKESINQYQINNRPELAIPEQEELAVLETYLPTQLSQTDILPIAAAKKAELGVEDKSKMGVLVGAIMKEVGGQADGGDVKIVVESLFE